MHMIKKITIIISITATIIVGALRTWYYLGIRLPSGTTIQTSMVPGEMIDYEDVFFKNETTDLTLAGTLYTPKSFDPTQEYAGIVITGPMLSVKEQAQTVYAQKLAESGYVTFVFDFSHFGESEGEPRQFEDPTLHHLDISSAVNYLTSLDFVDNDRVAGIGMCGSGSYMPMAAIDDTRIKSVISIVPAITNMMDSARLSQEDIIENRRQVEAGQTTPTYMNMMPRFFAEGATE